MKHVRVLSLDGGGLRGIAPLRVLHWIEAETGQRIHELFDAVAGTSTGGIIACGLVGSADGERPVMDLGQILALYENEAATIFPPAQRPLQRLSRSVRSLFDPRFDPNGLDVLLRRSFSDLRLSSALVPVIVPAYDLAHNEVLVFKSRKAANPAFDCTLREVCRATSAAPTYLPSFPMPYPDRSGVPKPRVCIDGGVYLNNPALAAVAELVKHGHRGEPVQLAQIKCLSLGTGIHLKDLDEAKSSSWGIFSWARPITDVMMQASSMSVDYVAQQLLPDYLRLQFHIAEERFSNMADARPETRAHWEERIEQEVLTEANKDRLRAFFQG